MTTEEIPEVCFETGEHVEGAIRGVVLSFHGLGPPPLREAPSDEELALARAGFLFVFPYCGPWTWMNRATREFVDDLVDAIYRRHALENSVPLVAMGGSMGGLASLLYARYARRKVARAVAVCPVCDLASHFHERPDLPRTIRYAFRGREESFEELLREHSPVEQAAAMPDIPYHITHTTGDPAVNKEIHSDKLVARMRERGLAVEYVEIESDAHCGPLPDEANATRMGFVMGAIK